MELKGGGTDKGEEIYITSNYRVVKDGRKTRSS